MFGFLSLKPRDRRQRQAYARCCRMQHLEYGVTGLPWLSYEGVFLYLCAMDAGHCPAPAASEPTCCRLRTSRSLLQEADAPFASYSAAVGILLAGVKTDDDVRDSHSPLSRFLKWSLKHKVARAHAAIHRVDPGLLGRLSACIARHLQLESSDSVIGIRDYARPTADAFGELFASSAELVAHESGRFRESMKRLGELVGSAIIARDCAIDWQKDLRSGDFNPVSSHAAAEDARDEALNFLSAAIWTAAAEFGETSSAVSVLRHNFDRLAAHCSVRDVPSLDRTLERWGLRREPGYAYAGCDAPCDLACACDAAGCEACSSAEGAGCCCDACVSGGDCCLCLDSCAHCGTVEETRSRRARREERVTEGEIAEVESTFDRTGVVAIDGVRLPARALDVESIAGGSRLRILRESAAGVVVTATPASA